MIVRPQHLTTIQFHFLFQVHKGFMHVNMVQDETIIQEMTEDSDDEGEIDFAEGRLKKKR